MSELGQLASGIYSSEFDSDSSAANYSQISGWLSENLGLLNTLINTNFSGQNPSLGLEEQAIYKEIYLYNYYNKQARSILRGITATSNAGDNILSVSDGDNSISFVNRNEVGKVYRDLAKESKQKLDGLVTKYTIYESQPLQVGGYESVSYEAQIAAAAAGGATQIPTIPSGDPGSEVTLDDQAHFFFDGTIPDGGIVDAGEELGVDINDFTSMTARIEKKFETGKWYILPKDTTKQTRFKVEGFEFPNMKISVSLQKGLKQKTVLLSEQNFYNLLYQPSLFSLDEI